MKMKIKIIAILVMGLLSGINGTLFAHCDSYDGPVIKDALKALETNDVNLVLKWVDQKNEPEIIDLFNKTFALKDGDKEIFKIVEIHFLETLVRLHRESEGEPYTGLKPAGSTTPVVKMADNALGEQNIEDLLEKLNAHIDSVIREKYEKVSVLSKVKETTLEKGREYVKAYVDYTHTLEAIHTILEDGAGHDAHKN